MLLIQCARKTALASAGQPILSFDAKRQLVFLYYAVSLIQHAGIHEVAFMVVGDIIGARFVTGGGLVLLELSVAPLAGLFALRKGFPFLVVIF